MSHTPMVKLKYPFFIFLVCLIAFLPLSSFLFALKNDAFIYNFPNKFFFSEALRHGYLPVWNPYLNFGFPLYADPGFAWWHPITWLFGVLGYNAYTFTIEVLLYIYIAGLGMYWLGRNLNFHKKTSLMMGCMYMCSGFFIGNLQHINFLTCAAFLPWLISFWLLYQQKPTLINFAGFGMAIFLLCAGGHPAIPIGTAFFLGMIVILYPLFFQLRNKLRFYLINQVQLITIGLLFLSPILLSYCTLFPYYSRSGPVNHLESANVGFTPLSYLSFIFPFCTIKGTNFFLTDVSMRNAYFSLLGIFSFILFIINRQKNKLQYIFLIAGALMLFISFGGHVKENIYTHLPLLKSVRTNGEFRVFAIFSFILCGSFELNQLFTNERLLVGKWKSLFKWLLIFSLLASFILVALSNPQNIISSGSASIIQTFKQIIDNITFPQAFLISFISVSLLSAIYLWSFSHIYRSKKILIAIFLLDICLNCWLMLPITGVGKTSVKSIQQIITKSPKGFPFPQLNNNQTISKINEDETILIGNWSWYDKQIIHPRIEYPSQLISTMQFYRTIAALSVWNKPFVFLKHNSQNHLTLTHFTPNSFSFNLEVPKSDTLIVLQNFFPGWVAKINNNVVPITKHCGTFISIPVNKGAKTASFQFFPFKGK